MMKTVSKEFMLISAETAKTLWRGVYIFFFWGPHKRKDETRCILSSKGDTGRREQEKVANIKAPSV